DRQDRRERKCFRSCPSWSSCLSSPSGPPLAQAVQTKGRREPGCRAIAIAGFRLQIYCKLQVNCEINAAICNRTRLVFAERQSQRGCEAAGRMIEQPD